MYDMYFVTGAVVVEDEDPGEIWVDLLQLFNLQPTQFLPQTNRVQLISETQLHSNTYHN